MLCGVGAPGAARWRLPRQIGGDKRFKELKSTETSCFQECGAEVGAISGGAAVALAAGLAVGLSLLK